MSSAVSALYLVSLNYSSFQMIACFLVGSNSVIICQHSTIGNTIETQFDRIDLVCIFKEHKIIYFTLFHILKTDFVLMSVIRELTLVCETTKNAFIFKITKSFLITSIERLVLFFLRSLRLRSYRY